jgi:hypothetical protein
LGGQSGSRSSGCDYTEARQNAKAKGWQERGKLLSFRMIALLVLMASMSATRICAQNSSPVQAPPEKNTTQAAAAGTKVMRPEHHFWDKENAWLFAGVGASRTLDYFSTLNLRRRHDQEILVTNDLVDHHAAFAVVEAAGTGVSIGASYLFHRYGHHKLERWTSIVHIGLTAGGAVRNYSLKTAHPKNSP